MTEPTWTDAEEPDLSPPTAAGWLRAALRGIPASLLVFGGCVILLAVRILVERPLFGQRRPVTPRITVFACRNALRLMGIGYVRRGRPMRQHGAIVANHTSWLDIFALNSGGPLYFVSKSEVEGWPGIGWLARTTGTVFIARDRKHARAQRMLFEERLHLGHKLLFFPEGTSTDGLTVLPFKTTLFEAFFTEGLKDEIAIQPVTVTYHAPRGAEPNFYGWWGEMSFSGHLLRTLAAPRQGHIEVVYHEPLPVSAFPDRKTLAARAEAMVRSAHMSAAGASETPLRPV